MESDSNSRDESDGQDEAEKKLKASQSQLKAASRLLGVVTLPEHYAYFQPVKKSLNTHWPVDPSVVQQKQFIPHCLLYPEELQSENTNPEDEIALRHLNLEEDAHEDEEIDALEIESDEKQKMLTALVPPISTLDKRAVASLPWSRGGQLEFEKTLLKDHERSSMLPFIDGPGIDFGDQIQMMLGEELVDLVHHICQEPLKHLGEVDGETRAPRLRLDHRTSQMIVEDTMKFIDLALDQSLKLACHTEANRNFDDEIGRSTAGSWLTVISAMKSAGAPSEVCNSVVNIMRSLLAPSEQLDSLKRTVLMGNRRYLAAASEKRKRQEEEAQRRDIEDKYKFFSLAKRRKLEAGEELSDVDEKPKRLPRARVKKSAAAAAKKAAAKAEEQREDSLESSEEISLHSDDITPVSSSSSSSAASSHSSSSAESESEDEPDASEQDSQDDAFSD